MLKQQFIVAPIMFWPNKEIINDLNADVNIFSAHFDREQKAGTSFASRRGDARSMNVADNHGVRDAR